MKKIFGLLVIFAGVLASCQDDMPYHEPEDGAGQVLLKKMVVTQANGTAITSTYTYDGEKLTAVAHSNGTSESYNYNGSFISDARYYNNGGLVRKDTYLYDGTGAFAGFLASYYDLQNPNNSHAERFDYIFNGETVTVKKYTGTESQQNELVSTTLLNILNNNIKAKQVEGGVLTQYAFDFKNSPMRNIKFFNVFTLVNMEGGINNETGRNVNGTIINTVYNYLPNEYPAMATVTGGGLNYTVTYTY